MGYFKMPYNLKEHKFYNNPFDRLLYFTLLMKTNSIEKTTKKGQVLEVGQCVMGYDSLASELGVSRKKLTASLKRFIKYDLISIKSEVRMGTTITITDYEEHYVTKKAKTIKLKPKKSLVKVSKKTKEDREIDFRDSLVEHVEEYGKTTVRAFFNYWTESNPNSDKMRFEMQKVFDVKRRLKTWSDKDKEWNKKDDGITQADKDFQEHVMRQMKNR